MQDHMEKCKRKFKNKFKFKNKNKFKFKNKFKNKCDYNKEHLHQPKNTE
jgi:hypothetical protein